MPLKEKIIVASSSSRKRVMACPAGPRGESTRGGQEAEARVRGEHGSQSLLWFLRGKQGRAGPAG